MVEVNVFSCPSCNGKVVYNQTTNKWECSYCHKSFLTIFANTEKKVFEDPEPKDIYYHHCTKCDKEYTAFKEKDATCIYCGAKNNAYDSITASSFAKNTIDYNNIEVFYNHLDINKCPKQYKPEYEKLDFYLEYVNCDLIDGFIEIQDENYSKKYLFINLVVPNLDYEDYRFMYELGNNGIKIKNDANDYGVVLLETATKYQKYIKKKPNNNHIDNIINSCINTFQKEHHISDRNNITVNNYLKIKQGFYIPIYTKKVTINNDNYYQHIVANKDFSKIQYLQFPKIENAVKKSRLLELISQISVCFIVFFFVALFMTFIIVQNIVQNLDTTVPIFEIIQFVPLFGLPISIFIAVVSHRKIDFYYESAVISKEDYYDQIVNNSNYVKVIGGRK